jgi:hypothetical protein
MLKYADLLHSMSAKHYTYKIDSPIVGHKPSILFPNTSTDDDNYYRMEPKNNLDHYGLIPSDTRFAGYVWPGKFSTHKKLCLQYCHGSSRPFGLLLVDLPAVRVQHHPTPQIFLHAWAVTVISDTGCRGYCCRPKSTPVQKQLIIAAASWFTY